MVDLQTLLGRGTTDAVGTVEQAVHIVKAVALGVDDHHVLNAIQHRTVRSFDGPFAAQEANKLATHSKAGMRTSPNGKWMGWRRKEAIEVCVVCLLNVIFA
jgi:hypothetical protein